MLWTCASRPTFATSEDNKEEPLRQACITKVIAGIRPLEVLTYSIYSERAFDFLQDWSYDPNDLQYLQTYISRLKAVTTSHQNGFVSCSLKGGTAYEKSLFLDSMQEILGPLGRLIRKEYHAVPKVHGRNKELAGHFRKMWAKYVGTTELVYTRNVEGRKVLLKARGHAMSTSFQKRAGRIRTWK